MKKKVKLKNVRNLLIHVALVIKYTRMGWNSNKIFLFGEEGKPENLEKPPWSRNENQQQT